MTPREPAPALSQKAQEEAQELIYDAWEAGTHDRRRVLARKALSLNPVAADAYVILASDAEPEAKALQLLGHVEVCPRHAPEEFQVAIGGCVYNLVRQRGWRGFPIPSTGSTFLRQIVS
jgi:hypothetical protein